MIRLYPNELNANAVTKLAAKFPQTQMRVLLGNTPHIQLKCPRGCRNTEFLIDLLAKYNEFIKP